MMNHTAFHSLAVDLEFKVMEANSDVDSRIHAMLGRDGIVPIYTFDPLIALTTFPPHWTNLFECETMSTRYHPWKYSHWRVGCESQYIYRRVAYHERYPDMISHSTAHGQTLAIARCAVGIRAWTKQNEFSKRKIVTRTIEIAVPNGTVVDEYAKYAFIN